MVAAPGGGGRAYDRRMTRTGREPSTTEPAGAPDLLVATPSGLACPAGGFHVDPVAPVDLAVVTHAHADHATAGSGAYLASPATAALLRARLGEARPIREVPFGERVELGGTAVSLHPAGHVLGSAQVRVEPADGGPVWVVSGDYKVKADPTAEAFEAVPCDVFVTESTFALPVFRWDDPESVAAGMRAWWARNASRGRTSVIFAYSLGKAQRVVRALGDGPGPIGVHGAALKLCAVYRELGVALPDHVHASAETAPDLKGSGLIVAPPSQAGAPWLRRFAGPGGLRTASASGWMAIRGRRRWRALDEGFVISDHADWPGLLAAIEATGARRVGVTHGYATPFARFLREERGLDAFVLPTRRSDSADAEGPGAEAGAA